MGKQAITAVLVAALGAVLAAAPGQTQPQTSTKHASANTAGTHATRGVVKSVDGTTLVIARPDKKHSVMTFALNTSTQRPEGVAAGTPVSVRYREDGKTHVATAVTVQQKKPEAVHAASTK